MHASAQPVVEVDERDRKDYFTPSSSCFRDFCESCIERYKLKQHIIRRETVADVDYEVLPEIDRDSRVFRIRTNQQNHHARAVVLAIGGGKPAIPAPFPSELPHAATHAMWLEDNCVLSRQLQSKIRLRERTSALVIGGGLTSAQIVDCLVRKGVSQVHLIMRGPWKGERVDFASYASSLLSCCSQAFRCRSQLDEQVPQPAAGGFLDC